jgi:hypothetical protein
VITAVAIIISIFGGFGALALVVSEIVKRHNDKWHPESRRVRSARDQAEIARHRLSESRHNAQAEVIEAKKHQLLDAVKNGEDQRVATLARELTDAGSQR